MEYLDYKRLRRSRYRYTRSDVVMASLAAFFSGIFAITLVYALIVQIGGEAGIRALCGG